jgi:hypothetical protein
MGCRLQLLLVLASAIILRSESRGNHDHILVSQIRYYPNWGPGPRIYIPQEQGGLVILPGTESESGAYVTTDGQSASLS